MKSSRSMIALASTTVTLGLVVGALAYLARTGVSAQSTSGLPASLTWVPETAQVVGHVDMRAVAASPLADAVRRAAEREPTDDSANGQNFPAVEEIREATGIDLLEDVDSLSFSVTPSEGEPRRGRWGIVLTGDFDRDELVSKLSSRKEMERDQHEGVPLYRLESSGAGETVLAVPEGASTVLFGDAEYVVDMIDAGSGDDPSVTGEVQSWGYGSFDEEAFWIAGTPWGALPGLSRGDRGASGGAGAAATELRSFAISGRLASELLLRARGRAADPKGAQQLADVLRGLIALGRLQQGSSSELKEIAEAVRIELVEDEVELSLLLPYETVRRLLESRAAARAAQ